MKGSERRMSRLALLSLGVGTLWFMTALVAASAVYWYPWRDPQGWDKLAWLGMVYYGSVIVGMFCTVAGVAALIRIRLSQGGAVGYFVAIAGLVLGVLPAGLCVGLLLV